MRSLLKRRKPKLAPAIEPVAAGFPVLRDAQIAAVFAGQRSAGDFFDSIRVSRSRVLFGLLDVAGRREQNQDLLATAQRVFREAGTELLSRRKSTKPTLLPNSVFSLIAPLSTPQAVCTPAPHSPDATTKSWGRCVTSTRDTLLPSCGIPRMFRNWAPRDFRSGLFSHTTSDSQIIALEPGATLLLVSRGVVGAECNGEEFGLRRVEAALQNSAGANAHDVCVTVLDAMLQFACATPVQDDATCLTLIRQLVS